MTRVLYARLISTFFRAEHRSRKWCAIKLCCIEAVYTTNSGNVCRTSWRWYTSWKRKRLRSLSKEVVERWYFFGIFLTSGYGFKTWSVFNSTQFSYIQSLIHLTVLSLYLPFSLIFFLLELLKARLTRHRWFVKISLLRLQSYPHLSFSNYAREYRKDTKISCWLH